MNGQAFYGIALNIAPWALSMALAEVVDHLKPTSRKRSSGTGKGAAWTSGLNPITVRRLLKTLDKSVRLRRFCFTAE